MARILRHDHHQDFSPSASAPLSRLMSADVGDPQLDLSSQTVAVGADHGRPELVHPGPGGVVTAQTKLLLEAESAHPKPLIGHVPHGLEPNQERTSAAVENGPCSHGNLVIAMAAPEKVSPHQPGFLPVTPGAAKPSGPTELDQVAVAFLLGSEKLFEGFDHPPAP
jgi:hypothetical protein